MVKRSEEELEQIYKTLEFAQNAHHGQYYSKTPYYYHLLEVAQAVEFYNGDVTDMQIALLHDIIEDTKTTKEDIVINFNETVAEIVDLLTNRDSKEETFTRIRTNKTAVFIKLCDRLSNVSRGEKIEKYKLEHELFKNILYQDGEFDNIWKAIESKLGV